MHSKLLNALKSPSQHTPLRFSCDGLSIQRELHFAGYTVLELELAADLAQLLMLQGNHSFGGMAVHT